MKDIMWYEKWRPKKIDELVLPKSYSASFKRFIRQKDIPHLLLSGPPGSGKTTIASILVKKCAGKCLVSNSSGEDRTVAFVKKTVKDFASSKNKGQKKNIVFLDEANGLTHDAQEALKNIIETYKDYCRFILTTNVLHEIDDAIVSRCRIYEFDSFPKEDMKKQIKNILLKEKINFSPKDMKKVMERYYPDFRSILNVLQICLTGEDLDYLDPKLVKRIIPSAEEIGLLIKKGKLFEIRKTFANMTNFIWLYQYLFNNFIPEEIKKNKDKAEAAIIVADYLNREQMVPDREINAAACVIELMNFFDATVEF